MSTGQSRLQLQIDVFEKANQRAMALPNLTPPELVEAILQEFQELEYLGDTAEGYELHKASDQSPLESDQELQQQLAGGDRRLVLVEKELSPLPAGTKPPTKNAYLREQGSGRVFKLHWLPAIIGRPDQNQPYNDWVAVNLTWHESGLRVSRRHAQITEENGKFYVESLSGNPTLIKDAEGNPRAVNKSRQSLNDGDIIYLGRSNIAMKFIVREA